ncbi:hypothetical protein P22_1803 [Propionispora sp. 2/2-37]|uniref:GNAT family N-acetyltransferase n=1 Tax=Propionispora sp. 2/2-37 TaxID=1677858 RepID=UPI0006BB8E4C|nr:GNAT family protein [Propionispora sp. 2/2-37]CUH95723.1 hypothetical protein P22_1803 [Propionispora sp. 2/2-37]
MIIGEKVILRTVKASDLDLLYDMLSTVYDKGEYWLIDIPDEPGFRRAFDKTGFWQEDFGRMLLTDSDNSLLGEIFYSRVSDYRTGYEIGYQLFRPLSRGKGIMTEALRLFTNYLFMVMPIPRLQVTVISGNLPSRRVAEKCGYSYRGSFRNAVFHGGRYQDLELFDLIREDWTCFPLITA